VYLFRFLKSSKLLIGRGPPADKGTFCNVSWSISSLFTIETTHNSDKDIRISVDDGKCLVLRLDMLHCRI
jgi:hypothetical protein